MSRVATVLLAVAALMLLPASALGASFLTEDFESGAPGWTFSPFWHAEKDPQLIFVASGINPELVTLPDPGALPAPFGGSYDAWFGERSTGTFCGADWATVNSGQTKNGCQSAAPYSGDLISPTFSLDGASGTVQLTFEAWYEIEAVNADSYDVMSVDYSINSGGIWGPWNPLGRLNPLDNPAGAHDRSYSNNGLEQSPSWRPYIVDLTPAAGESAVRLRFRFDTVDSLYQGFRGFAVDNVDVAPFSAAAPQISSVEAACATDGGDTLAVLHGTNFVTGSQVVVDGLDAAGAVTSSERAETYLPAGTHSLALRTPGDVTSNTASVTVATCPVQQPQVDQQQQQQQQQVLGDMQLPPPIIGQTANAFPERGQVFVKLPPGFTAKHRWAHAAANRFIPLSQARTIPMGSVLDTKRGQVKLTMAGALAGSLQDGHFRGGLFDVRQSRTNPLTTLSLMGGGLGKCGSKLPKGGAAKRRARGRSLFSSVKGRFRTRGRNSSATVRGTEWVEKDTCAGTRTTVKSGTVVVQDFAKHRKITLRAGKSYLARPPRNLRR